MGPLIAMEVAALAGPLVGLRVESLQILFLLPFPWLLVESLERKDADARAPFRAEPVLNRAGSQDGSVTTETMA
jgi:hypothetical protein